MSTFFPLERRVVITGIGTINPLGHTVKEFWNNLAQGKSGIRPIQNREITDIPVYVAGEVDIRDEVKDYYISKKLYKRLDRFVTMGYGAAAQAYLDAGIDVNLSPERYGAIIGSGEGGLGTHWDQIIRLNEKGLDTASPYYITNVIPNTATALFCQERNIQGLSFSVNSACASSNHAIGIAVNLIKMGMADAIFAGGAEAVACEPGLAAFSGIGALSRRKEPATAASRPFDRDRDGFVMGEGAGVLCLEELDHARRRGAKIYGEVTGFGFTSDAHDLVAPHPEGDGAARAMIGALNMAGLNPEEIGLINCHGTSTPVGDVAEGLAIHRAFGDALGAQIPVHSTKSMIGHLIGAAGAVEAIAVLMGLTENIIHPSINVDNQDPAIKLNVVKETREEKTLDHALSNTFGFGGHNASVVLSRFRG